MNEIHITEIGNGTKCFNFNDYYNAGLSVVLYDVFRQATNGTILISNSLFKRIHNTALYIRSRCPTNKNIILLNRCVFHSIMSSNQPAVQVVLSDNNKVITFNNCTFKNNYAGHVVSMKIDQKMDDACRLILVNHDQSATFSSRLFIRGGQFVSNRGQVLLVRGMCIKKLKKIGLSQNTMMI